MANEDMKIPFLKYNENPDQMGYAIFDGEGAQLRPGSMIMHSVVPYHEIKLLNCVSDSKK